MCHDNLFQTRRFSEALEQQRLAWSLWYKVNDVKLPEGPWCVHNVEENLFFNWALFLYTAIFSSNEEEKLKFYITSCSSCLCNSAGPLQSLDHVGHVVSESGDLQY